MSKRMTSETIIFDTGWLTLADFGEAANLTVSIDYQAYDTLKIITPPGTSLEIGGVFQEFDVYKLENFGLADKILLEEIDGNYYIEHIKDEGFFKLSFYLDKSYWESVLGEAYSIYIKGVKR